MKYFFETKTTGIEFHIRNSLNFNAHLHDRIELGYLSSGSSDLYVDDKKYHVKKGDFFVVFPNQIHCYENSENVKSIVMIFSTEHVSEFRGILSGKIPVSPVVSGCPEEAVKLVEIMSNVADSAKPEVIHGITLALFALLIDSVELRQSDRYNISTIKNLLIYCDEHYTEHINIDDAAKALHISRSHISHIFKDKLHSTFEQYISEKRIDYACELLKNSDESVTNIAYMSGFDSIRTFNRVFAKNIGSSPREYRKNRNG